MGLIDEYFRRIWLKKVGYQCSELDVFKADCFVIIGSELQAIESKERQQKHGRANRS